MVVVLQEQNADVPPNLPNAAQAVLQTAVTLSKVAAQLASTNYKGFPDIAKEIIEAADAVTKATDVMTGAMKTLQTSSDRKVRHLNLIKNFSTHINSLCFASSFPTLRRVGLASLMRAVSCPVRLSSFCRLSTVLN